MNKNQAATICFCCFSLSKNYLVTTYRKRDLNYFQDSVRGAIGSLMQVFVTFGLLFVYSIGPYVPYMWLSIGAAVIPVLFVASFFWMPESPYYLLAVPDKEAAKKSLEWLRGKSGDGVEDELQEMQVSIKLFLPISRMARLLSWN